MGTSLCEILPTRRNLDYNGKLAYKGNFDYKGIQNL